MKLHRAKSRPDWKTIHARTRNFWQQLAASTKGWITPGNLLTLIGFALVVYGLVLVVREKYVAGLFALAIGRLGDVADGWLADVTGTKSPLGESLDAGLDKTSTVMTVVVFYIINIMPWWILSLLLLPHIMIAIITLIIIRANQRPHPSRLGKNSMALIWVCLIGFVSLRALEIQGIHPLTVVVYVLAGASIGLGLLAARNYAHRIPS